MSKQENHSLRQAFDTDPAMYDKARRGYPTALFQDILSYMGVSTLTNKDVLEIAPGTGQATKDLLKTGAALTAVELGKDLASYLDAKYKDEDNLTVLNSAFEAVDLPSMAYDLIVCATAWHWLDEDMRFVKAANLLKEKSILAIISTNQVSSDTDKGFFKEVDALYEQFGTRRKTILPDKEQIKGDLTDMQTSSLFDETKVYKYDWNQDYSTEQYLDLIQSYSGTIAMQPNERTQFLQAIQELIDTRFNGAVTRPLVIALTIGKECK